MGNINLVGFLEGLGRTSLQAGVLVLVILIAQWLLRKHLTARWRAALWMLIIARLLLPVSFESAISVFNLIPGWSGPADRSVAPRASSAMVNPGTQVLLRDQNAALLEPAVPPQPPLAQLGIPTGEPPSTTSSQPANQRPAEPPSRQTHPQLPWVGLVFWTWLVGVLGLAGYVLVSSFRLARSLKRLKPIAEPEVLAVLADCRTRMNVCTPLTVVESGSVGCPALYGLFRPRLVVPFGFTHSFSEPELRFIFLHELAHLKRFDLPINWLIAGLQVVHWFNPLVWVGFSRWRLDRELACDSMALDAAGADQNNAYGRTILRLVAGLGRPTPTPGLVGILETKQELRRRIAMIATYVPGRRWQILALLAAAAIGVTGLTDAQNKASDAKMKMDTRVLSSSASVQTNQVAAATPRPTVTNGPTMKVLVLDSQTSRPVADAEVLAPNHAAFFSGKENAPRWLTDQDGAAIIHLGEVPSNHLAAQSWFTVSVRSKDYAPRGLSWSAENKDVRPSLPGEVTVRLKKGVTVGGVVRDEKGAPVSGVHVRVFGTRYWEGMQHEYSEYWTDGGGRPEVLTDYAGHWAVTDFPSDLNGLAIELVQPDGSLQRFRKPYPGQEQDTRNPGEPIDLEDLRAGKAVFVLKSGLDVRGVVVDPVGNPVPNVLVRGGTGAVNRQRLQEFRTDVAGQFQIHHLLRRQLILTAYPDAFAISSTVVDVTPNAPQVRLQLAPLRPLHIRVLNGTGRAVAGAKVTVDSYRSENQVLDFAAETDANGWLVWTNAPASSFPLVASALSINCRQKIRVAPTQQYVTFALREGMAEEVIITGRARDAKSGSPVKLQSVNYKTDFNAFEPAEETPGPGFRLTISAKRFTPGGMYPRYRLQLRAEGYSTLVTPWRDFDEGDWDQEFALQPASESSATILLPNGQPAAKARGWIRADMNDGPLYCYMPNQFSDERWIRLRTDAEGKVVLPSIPDDQPVVFVHPGGCLETSFVELKHSPVARLQPWGRVEGRLRIDGRPKGGIRINLSSLLFSPSVGFQLSYSASTAADGSFVFTNVQGGEYKIWRQLAERIGRAITEDHQMPVTIRPGETVEVEYGGGGRPIFGQAKPDQPGLAVDWLNDDHTLTLKQPAIQPLNIEDFASSTSYQQAYYSSYSSPERLKLAREARTYLLSFEQDGSFRTDDVRPGTYEVRISVNKPGAPQQFNPLGNPKGDLGSLVREVIVPPGDGPFDLGTLVVPMKGVAGGKKSEPLNLAAQTLDGRPISLDQFKGKYVLLAFWGSWSERSVEGLADLKELQSQFGKDPRIDFLAVSVDQDIADARKVAQTNQYSWNQAWVAPEKATKLTAALDVNTLPAVFLIDPDGRIVGRDMEGERLKAAVRRALSTN